MMPLPPHACFESFDKIVCQYHVFKRLRILQLVESRELTPPYRGDGGNVFPD
jgi:hypothetical protein